MFLIPGQELLEGGIEYSVKACSLVIILIFLTNGPEYHLPDMPPYIYRLYGLAIPVIF